MSVQSLGDFSFILSIIFGLRQRGARGARDVAIAHRSFFWGLQEFKSVFFVLSSRRASLSRFKLFNIRAVNSRTGDGCFFGFSSEADW